MTSMTAFSTIELAPLGLARSVPVVQYVPRATVAELVRLVESNFDTRKFSRRGPQALRASSRVCTERIETTSRARVVQFRISNRAEHFTGFRAASQATEPEAKARVCRTLNGIG